MKIIMDTLRYTNIPTMLSMIITMSGDQATISQLKKELETAKKSNCELVDKLEKLEDSLNLTARTNNELKLDATNRE